MKRASRILSIFLIVALFVSCSANLEETDSELVKVGLAIGNVEKSLTVAGSDASDITSYAYCMQPKFTSSNITNPTSGTASDNSYPNTSWTTLVITNAGANTGTGELGYCTQGLWDVKIRGYNKNNVPVYEGELKDLYINKNTTGISIDLRRIFENPTTGSTKATLRITADTVQVSSNTSMRVSYSKVTGSASGAWTSEQEMSVNTTYTSAGRIGYKFEDANVEPGRYLIKVTYYNTTPTEVKVGSQILAVTAIAGSPIDISGSLDTNMFKSEGVTITTEGAITVNITSADSSTTSHTDFTCNVVTGPVDGTYTYEWYVNGDKDTANSSANKLTFPKEMSANATYADPGYYDITCVVYWEKNTDNAIVSASTTAVVNAI